MNKAPAVAGPAWLRNSLNHKIRELRGEARRIRKYSGYNPIREHADALASVYEEAADVFERAFEASND